MLYKKNIYVTIPLLNLSKPDRAVLKFGVLYMKLSMWTLCDYLIKEGFDTESYISEGLPCIGLLRQTKERTYSEGYAEIFEDDSCVYVVNDMDSLIVRNACAVDVTNCLGKALEFYSGWEHDLYECVLRKGTLQELLDIANVIFQRPMFIKNDATRTLAITHGYPQDVHPYWNKIEKSLEQGLPDYEMVSLVSSDPEYRNAFLEKYPSIRVSPAYGAMVLHANIFVNDRRAAEVVTLENGKPFNKGDIHLMNTFTELLVKYVNSNNRIFQSGSDVAVFLTNLLENGRLEKEQYQTIRRFLKSEDDDYMCILVVNSLGRLDSPILSVLREKLETQLKDSVVIQYGAQIVILRPLKGMTYNEMVEDFKKIIPKEGFRWGLSYEFSLMDALPDYYKKTCEILEQAAFKGEHFVTMYEMAPRLIAQMCGVHESSKTLIHPDLLRLDNADIRDNTEYLETLYYYLLCGGNFTDAARIMVLHRNTMIYRMNKIRELTCSNLDDDIENRKLLLYSYLLLDR